MTRAQEIAMFCVLAFTAGGLSGFFFPKAAAPSYQLSCQRMPQTLTSNTPGVIVEPVMMCWRKFP